MHVYIKKEEKVPKLDKHSQSVMSPWSLAPLGFMKEGAGVCSLTYFPSFVAEFKFTLFYLEYVPLLSPPFIHPVPPAFSPWPRHFLFLSFFFTPSHTSDIWPPPVPFLNCGGPSSPTHFFLGESNKRLSGKVDERGLVLGWRLIEVDNGTGPPLPLPPFRGRVTGRPQMCRSGELNGCCMAGSRSTCVGRNYIRHKSIGWRSRGEGFIHSQENGLS